MQTLRYMRVVASTAMALALTMVGASIPCFALDRAGAEKALMQGRVDEAVAALQAINPKDGQVHLLLCRAYYAEELSQPAVEQCEAALQTLGNSSEAQDWMGRAYGLKANQSGPLAGYKLAKKVKAAFEAAVSLDPKNSAATDDLSEYYVGAPPIVGGGVDKAEDLAARTEKLLPQSGHRMRGLIAEKQKDYGTAEREFRAAVGVSGRAEAWIDLGNFYSRRKDGDKTVDAVQHAVAANRSMDGSLVDAASILDDVHREPKLAEKWLRTYLDKGLKSDAAPAFKAKVLLAKLLGADGDKAGAKIELQQALALAADYEPAKKALQKL